MASKSGELRERVVFQFQQSSDDGYGNTEGAWADGPTVAARIQPLRGAETVQAARLAGRQPVKITIRWSSATAAITPDWRVQDVRSGVIYNVRSVVNPDEHKRFLELECEKGVAT